MAHRDSRTADLPSKYSLTEGEASTCFLVHILARLKEKSTKCAEGIRAMELTAKLGNSQSIMVLVPVSPTSRYAVALLVRAT